MLSELSALRYNYRYEYKKLRYQVPGVLTHDFFVKVCVSFKNLQQVSREHFEQILEWSSNEQRCHVTGIIHFTKLLKTDWWKQPGISLIAYPECVTDNYKSRKTQQHVLELAEL